MPESARERLAELLGGLAELAASSAYCKLFMTDLSVTVDGVGELTFPVPADQAAGLRALGSRARFGRREETLTDLDVRDTWEIPKVHANDGNETAADTARDDVLTRSPSWQYSTNARLHEALCTVANGGTDQGTRQAGHRPGRTPGRPPDRHDHLHREHGARPRAPRPAAPPRRPRTPRSPHQNHPAARTTTRHLRTAARIQLHTPRHGTHYQRWSRSAAGGEDAPAEAAHGRTVLVR